jgi:hypothetical protein
MKLDVCARPSARTETGLELDVVKVWPHNVCMSVFGLVCYVFHLHALGRNGVKLSMGPPLASPRHLL